LDYSLPIHDYTRNAPVPPPFDEKGGQAATPTTLPPTAEAENDLRIDFKR